MPASTPQPHPSNSDLQQLSSPELAAAWLADPAGGHCDPSTIQTERRLYFDNGAHCVPDGLGTTAAGDSVVVEVKTGVPARDGQLNAVTNDLCKLAGLKNAGKADRAVLLLTSPQLHEKVTGATWRMATAEASGVEVVLVDPGEELAARLTETSTRQGAAFRT